MIDRREIAESLRGALRLARFDTGGMADFNVSNEGFWRSFAAPFAMLPGQFVLISATMSEAAGRLGWFQVLLAESLIYAVTVFAFAVIMQVVAGLIGRADKYLGFIVAYNWATVVQVGVILLALFVSAADRSGALGFLLAGAAMVAVLVYSWFVARTALTVPSLVAAAIVGSDIALTVAVSEFGEWRLLGV